MATSYRQQRVADFIQEQLAELLMREARDPRLSAITVSAVEVSPDLRQAHIYFSLIGDAAAVKEAQRGLDHASGFLRRVLASRLQLRVVPTLTFHHDKSLETGSRIEELLHQIEEEDSKR
jgi:ribosome-binding factor A